LYDEAYVEALIIKRREEHRRKAKKYTWSKEHSNPNAKINGKYAESQDWGLVGVLMDPPFKGNEDAEVFVEIIKNEGV
jgi:hypothetical protein